MRVVTFKIDEDLLEMIDMYARKTGYTRSEVIRKALVELLKRELAYTVSKRRSKASKKYIIEVK